MYSQLLPLLRCPSCQSTLELRQPAYGPDAELLSGQLGCAGCGARYRIRHGIADFLGIPRPFSPAQLVNELPPTAWGYERLWRPFALSLFSGQRFGYARELPLIAALAEPQRDGLYMDIACGNGLYARTLARTLGAGGMVAAIDHSMPMLREAASLARAAGLRISFIRARAQALPIAPASSAACVIGGSLNEIGDIDGCLAEIKRCLADGGRFVAMTLSRADTPAGRLLQRALGGGGIRFWTAQQLIELFRRQQLHTSGCWRYGIVVFTQSTLQRRI